MTPAPEDLRRWAVEQVLAHQLAATAAEAVEQARVLVAYRVGEPEAPAAKRPKHGTIRTTVWALSEQGIRPRAIMARLGMSKGAVYKHLGEERRRRGIAAHPAHVVSGHNAAAAAKARLAQVAP